MFKTVNRTELAKELTDLKLRSLGQMSGLVWDPEIIRAAPNILKFNLRASNQGINIWEYTGSTGEIALEKPENDLEIVDMCGAIKQICSFSVKLGQKLLDDADWKDWFLSRARDCYLVPDTNFILNHHCSNLLSRILGQDFKLLKFRIPRLVILEIERQGNQKDEMKKRFAFYAAREIAFLKNAKDFGPLPDAGDELITSFPKKAGEGFTDIWIRREIYWAVQTGIRPILFLTGDLMNALAAEAEGLETCYFSRLPQERFFIDLVSSEQLVDLILATAMKFNNIVLDIILNGETVHKSLKVQGMWSGKTTSEWYSDSVKVED